MCFNLGPQRDLVIDRRVNGTVDIIRVSYKAAKPHPSMLVRLPLESYIFDSLNLIWRLDKQLSDIDQRLSPPHPYTG
ncbi:hypothetical protein D3C84_1004060 [compost metagenome]